MTKFNNAADEKLYGEHPDEWESDQEYGGSWYGLYRAELSILEEDQQGFVTRWQYDDADALLFAWDEIVREIGSETEEG